MARAGRAADAKTVEAAKGAAVSGYRVWAVIVAMPVATGAVGWLWYWVHVAATEGLHSAPASSAAVFGVLCSGLYGCVVVAALGRRGFRLVTYDTQYPELRSRQALTFFGLFLFGLGGALLFVHVVEGASPVAIW